MRQARKGLGAQVGRWAIGALIAGAVVSVAVPDSAEAFGELFELSGPATVVEGDSGVTTVTYTLTSSVPVQAGGCQVNVSGTNGSATWPDDWELSGVTPTNFVQTVTIPAGATKYEFGIDVKGDTIDESAVEQYYIASFRSLTCGFVLDATKWDVKTVITDDDSVPAALYSIKAPAPVIEGNSGTKPMTFTISSPVAPAAPCQVLVTALNLTAAWAFDWEVPGGGAPGLAPWQKVLTLDSNSATFDVSILGETLGEIDETLTVNIIPWAAPTPCAVDPTAYIDTGTIKNDDGAASAPFTITAPAPTPEGNSGTKPMTFKIGSGLAPAAPCQLLVTALNATAFWTIDWNLAGESLYYKVITIEGSTAMVDVDIIGETLGEIDETFTVNILPYGATPCQVDPVKWITTGTILNDDGPPSSTRSGVVSDAEITEGDNGTKNLTFTVNLDGPATGKEAFEVFIDPSSTASAGGDYASCLGEGDGDSGEGADGEDDPDDADVEDNIDDECLHIDVKFKAGATSATFVIPVIGDTAAESTETIKLLLKDPWKMTLAKSTATGTILDNGDTGGGGGGGPTVSVNDVSMKEGKSGDTKFVFTLTLSAPVSVDSTVLVKTDSVTASSSSDYTSVSTRVTIKAGTTSKTVTVIVKGDKKKEADETFQVLLSKPSRITVADGVGIGTILNDD